MKKITISFGLVVVLVIGSFGGIVMAAPEQTPLDCCRDILNLLSDLIYNVSETGEDVDYVVTAVDEIGSDVSETGEDVDYVVTAVDEIGSDVSETGEDVDYVVTAVDEISDNVSYIVSEVNNVVHMATDSGVISVKEGTKSGTEIKTLGKYDEIRHVVVTLYTSRALSEDDGVAVNAYWPGMEGCIVASFLSGSDEKAKTIEFNASKWEIDCQSGRTGFNIYYVVTSTYVPAETQ